jgi:S-adenosylmethionine/arginine decarboxylase-like enzyme
MKGGLKGSNSTLENERFSKHYTNGHLDFETDLPAYFPLNRKIEEIFNNNEQFGAILLSFKQFYTQKSEDFLLRNFTETLKSMINQNYASIKESLTVYRVLPSNNNIEKGNDANILLVYGKNDADNQIEHLEKIAHIVIDSYPEQNLFASVILCNCGNNNNPTFFFNQMNSFLRRMDEHKPKTIDERVQVNYIK